MSIQFEKYDENDKLIKTGYNDELDNLIKDKLETKDKINSIVNYLETLFVKKEKVKSDYIKKNYTSVGELILTLTKNRSKILNEIIKKQNSTIELKYNSSYDNSEVIFLFTLNNIYFRDFNKTSVLLCSKEIDILISNIHNQNYTYNETLVRVYNKVIKEIYDDYFIHLTNMTETLKLIDIYNTKCNLIKELNLCKPNIINKEYSFVDAKKMRHILIETIEKNEIYVPNDICLKRYK